MARAVFMAAFLPEDDGGFSVTFPDVPATITQGDDFEAALLSTAGISAPISATYSARFLKTCIRQAGFGQGRVLSRSTIITRGANLLRLGRLRASRPIPRDCPRRQRNKRANTLSRCLIPIAGAASDRLSPHSPSIRRRKRKGVSDVC